MSGVWQYRRNSNHDFCDEARPPVRVPPMTEKLIPALLVSSWKCSGSDLRLLAKKSWSDPVPGRAFHPAVDQRFSRRTVNACSIKGNVKKNISPSTGSGETFLDFQPLSALCEALGSVLLPCGLWGLTLFHLSSFIFVSSDDADRSLKLASAAVVRCQPWIYLR